MRSVCITAALFALPSLLLAQGKNVLFYGNSFSYFNGGVAHLVRLIAQEAGLPVPFCQEQWVAGQDLLFHATDPTQVAAISNSLPAGQTWDIVVMQGISTEATVALGDPVRFRNAAIQILGNVRAHSPAVTGVMYQTSVRAAGHAMYPTSFPNPLAMHNEVRDNYRNVIPALVAAHGPNAAVNAATGDCAAYFEFAPSIYFNDLHHPGYPLTLMASMCLFTSIYGRLVWDITPNFAQPSPLAVRLTQLGINLADWQRFAGIADLCADRSRRVFPGSGDDLLLDAAAQTSTLTALPRQPSTIGSNLQLRLRSQNGIFDQAPAFLLIDLFPTGQPPAPSLLYPEIAIDFGGAGIAAQAATLTTPLTLGVTMPFTLPGLSVLVQGLVLAPSAETGNLLLTTTDAIELAFF
jgi:hypothetical protein